MFQIAHDLRSSVRSLLRRPFYPIVAVIILALGLSASIAVFTYINGFYRPFPGVDADGLVRVFGIEGESPYTESTGNILLAVGNTATVVEASVWMAPQHFHNRG
jgi:hypothetical protein